MKRVSILCLLFAGCATTPKLTNSGTASDQFASLNRSNQWVAKNFYDLGQGDAVKRLYWAQRNVQIGGRSTAQETSLQHRYINIAVPAHTDPDGTEIEAANHAVEIVQLWKVVQNHGQKLSLVK